MEHWLDEPHHDPSLGGADASTPRLGDAVPVRVWVPHAHRARQVVLRVLCDAEPLVTPARIDREDDTGTWWSAEVAVRNPVASYRFLLDGADGSYAWLNGSGRHGHDVTDAEDFRLVAETPGPSWAAESVVYQVFPDRFARSSASLADGPDAAARRPGLPEWAVPVGWDEPVAYHGPLTGRQFYGGDLWGLAEHLDHISSLGADVLSLTPFFQAGSTHRYDATTFDRVDPLLGGEAALRALIAAAHARGLRVLGDLTTNHTGSGHEWFTAAQADADSVEAGFYRFTEHPHGYASWLTVPSLPKLDHASPELRRRLITDPDSVVARWLRPPVDLDGWRIDVANMTGRLGVDDRAHEVARAVRAAMAAVDADDGRQRWLLAEHGHDAGGDLAARGWHGTMNYSTFTRPLWSWLTVPGHGIGWLGMPLEVPSLSGRAMVATMRAFVAGMPWAALTRSVNSLDSHDTARFRTVVGGERTGAPTGSAAGRERHLVGLALQATLPGVPMVFAGDEFGLTGLTGEHSRTPMPWNRPDRTDAPTLDAYRFWLRLRRENVALRRGGLRWVRADDDSVTFLREHPDQRVLVHVDRGQGSASGRRSPRPVHLPRAGLGLVSGDRLQTLAGADAACEDEHTVTLPSASGGGVAAHVYQLSPQ